MASALPIVLAAGAAALLLGKKKKKAAPPPEGEPEFAPGAGMDMEPGVVIEGARITGIPAQAQPELLVAVRATSKKDQEAPERMAKKAEEDQKEDEKKNPPKETRCKIGTVSPDKKEICWGDPAGAFTASLPQRVKMRRVPKYTTARNAAAAVALTGGIIASPAMRVPQTRFLLYCWANRERKGIYRCTRRYKRGKKRCTKWARY